MDVLEDGKGQADIPDYVVSHELLLAANFSYIAEIVLDFTEARIALEYAAVHSDPNQ